MKIQKCYAALASIYLYKMNSHGKKLNHDLNLYEKRKTITLSSSDPSYTAHLMHKSLYERKMKLDLLYYHESSQGTEFLTTIRQLHQQHLVKVLYDKLA